MAVPPSAPDESAFQTLQASLRGTIIRRDHPEYDSARRLWNGMIDRRPFAIVRCRDVADVVAAVRFARAERLPLSVRGGGHGVAGTAAVDDGVMIDLSPMRGVDVDPTARTVRVQGGALWGDVDHATQLFGLAVPGGFISTTGVGGFTLGGGIAWTSRKLGLACDQLLSAQLVDASGAVLTVSAEEHPKLLRALRGAGSSFGVVTSFEFRLQEVGPVVYGGFRIFPAERGGALLRLVRDLYARTPEELNVLAMLTTAPPAPFIPPELHGRQIAILACCYTGPLEKGPAVTQELRALEGAAVDHVGPMPYLALQTGFDASAPAGQWNYWKSAYADVLPDAAIDEVLSRAASAPSPLTEIHFQYTGGAIARAPPEHSVVGHRGSPFLFNLVAKWTDPADTERNVAYIRDFWEALRPYSTGGVYVNFLGETSAELTKAAFAPETLTLLRELKTRYDPENVFRGSQELRP